MELTDDMVTPPELEVEHKTLENHVFEALGYASMCWNPRPTGEFDSSEALKCGEQLMKHINTDVPHACGIVFKALREDNEYYYAWQATIAMAFKDVYYEEMRNDPRFPMEPDIHKIANEAAKRFLNLLIKPI